VVAGAGKRKVLLATMSGREFKLLVHLRPASTTSLTLATDAPRVIAPGDERDLRVRLALSFRGGGAVAVRPRRGNRSSPR
jgi:hypothetical protein